MIGRDRLDAVAVGTEALDMGEVRQLAMPEAGGQVVALLHDQGRSGGAAGLDREGAAGMEGTAGGNAVQAGRRSSDALELPFARRSARDRLQQSRGIGVRRPGEDA